MSIREQIVQFISTEFSDGPAPASIGPEDDLIKQGIVDSMGVLQIVGFIEETYGASVVDDDIKVENFRSVTSIADLIAEKTGIAA